MEEEIPSISFIYPFAFIYENEIKELFGVMIRDITMDFNNPLDLVLEDETVVEAILTRECGPLIMTSASRSGQPIIREDHRMPEIRSPEVLSRRGIY